MKRLHAPAHTLALLGLAAAFAACGVSPTDRAEPAEVGAASQALNAGDFLYPSCPAAGYVERHNPEWPLGAEGACPGSPELTLTDAVTWCGGARVKYYGAYGCGNTWDGKHVWTAYYACCAPEALGADCTQDSQCLTGRCGEGIGFETRYYDPTIHTPPQSVDATIDTFYSLARTNPGYGYSALPSTDTFSNHAGGPGRLTTSFASHLRATFHAAQAGTWRFRLGPDYGLGGVLLVDRQEPAHDQDHITHAWADLSLPLTQQGIHWGTDFTHPDQYFEGYVDLGAGDHEVEAFGFENCCDGDMKLEVMAPGGTWQPISALAHRYCAPPLGQGAACGQGSDCTSGHCVDGVCCNEPCEGACMACSAVKKGGGADGACGPIASGLDPDNECPDAGPCHYPTLDGCNGAGACLALSPRPAGVLCNDYEDKYCAGDGTFHLPICDGAGACDYNAHILACSGHFNCYNQMSCYYECTANYMCASGYVCDLPSKQCVAAP